MLEHSLRREHSPGREHFCYDGTFALDEIFDYESRGISTLAGCDIFGTEPSSSPNRANVYKTASFNYPSLSRTQMTLNGAGLYFFQPTTQASGGYRREVASNISRRRPRICEGCSTIRLISGFAVARLICGQLPESHVRLGSAHPQTEDTFGSLSSCLA